MATHDYVIDNSTGANVRADINSVLQAILTNNSNSSSPGTTAAYMLWADTSASIMKMRNSSDNAWINLFTLAGGIDVDAASNFNEDVTFTGASANVTFDKSSNELLFADNAKASFGNNGDLVIRHNGTHSIIEDVGTGNLQLRCNDFRVTNSDNSETMITGDTDSSVALYFDGSKKCETSTEGLKIDGGLLEIAHTSCHIDFMETSATNHRLRNGSGNFHIQRISDDKSTTVTQFMIDGGTGSVELYHEGSRKFRTISAGTVFDGDLNGADNSKITLGSADDLRLYHDGTKSYIDNNTGDLEVTTPARIEFQGDNGAETMSRYTTNAGVELFYDNTKRFETLSDGTQIKGVSHLVSEDGNATATKKNKYFAIGTDSSLTITLASLATGYGVFRMGGYGNAGQSAVGLHIIFSGFMTGTTYYEVDVLQNFSAANSSISLAKNSGNYVITVNNTSSSQNLIVTMTLESCGGEMSMTLA